MHPLDSLDKEAWRARLLTARSTLSADARVARDEALRAGALRLAADTGGPICAYVPVGGEPGGPTLVSALVDAGHEVLLPVVPRERGPLEWARFDGSFARGPLGLREPTGERLGVEAIGTAALVLVPGLAVDRRGIRLGRGAGMNALVVGLAFTVGPTGQQFVVVESPFALGQTLRVLTRWDARLVK